MDLGRYDESEASYAQTIKLKPDFAEAHSNLGDVLNRMGKFGVAEASFAKAIALKPNFAEALQLGYYTALGRYEEAELSYLQTIKLKPSLPKLIITSASLHKWEIRRS